MSTQFVTNEVQFTETQIEILTDALGNFIADENSSYSQEDVEFTYDLIWKLLHSVHQEY